MIIPMYNAERFIIPCLLSVLGQTFENFEVIVVDDCSTDNSYSIVENFAPRFGGRLKLIKMKNNSGSPAEPSNRGLNFARGKYIYFMDNDDLLLDTALEYFYELAESLNVDVIHMYRRFEFYNSEENFPSVVQILPTHGGMIVNEPTFDTENVFERVVKLCRNEYARAAWNSFVRRDFLIENDIVMEALPWGVDTVWTFKVIFCAKRVLHIPQPFYAWRQSRNSISHHSRDLQEYMTFHIHTTINGTKQLCNFMNNQNFFKENPVCYFAVIDYFWNNHISFLGRSVANLNPNEFYERVKTALSTEFTDTNDAKIIAYLYTQYNFSTLLNQQRINELENKIKQLQGG